MPSSLSRRDFLRTAAAGAAALPFALRPADDSLYRISLAQWSLHRSIFGGEMDALDFAPVAKEQYGVEGVEYVNQFFMDKAQDRDYLATLKGRADDAGVQSLLIMCDNEGRLGDPDDGRRTSAVENHYKWVEAAEYLGCHSIRVNASSDGTYEEQQRLAADGLRRLAEFADEHGLYVLVENHGGLSSNGAWLAGVMEMTDHPRVGTLPDFGNFRVSAYGEEPEVWYDRYEGVDELMPYAQAVSAKTHDFTDDGYEANTDYDRMMQIVLDHGYRGWVGIEYEGADLPEDEGIRMTKALLERVRDDLAASY